MALDRLKSRGRGREGSFDVRALALPEVKEKEEIFPEELIAPYWDKFIEYFRQPENLEAESFEEALRMIYFLCGLFPEKQMILKELLDELWKKHNQKILQEIKKGLPVNNLLMDLYLCAPNKCKLLINILRNNRSIMRQIEEEYNSDPQPLIESIVYQRKPRIFTAKELEDYQELFVHIKVWHEYAQTLFVRGISRPQIQQEYMTQDSVVKKNMRSAGKAHLDDFLNALTLNIEYESADYYNLAEVAFNLKVLYAKGMEVTPTGLRFIETVKKEPEFIQDVPQPLTKEI